MNQASALRDVVEVDFPVNRLFGEPVEDRVLVLLKPACHIDRVLSVEQRDHPTLELPEGMAFQLDFSTFGDEV